MCQWSLIYVFQLLSRLLTSVQLLSQSETTEYMQLDMALNAVAAATSEAPLIAPQQHDESGIVLPEPAQPLMVEQMPLPATPDPAAPLVPLGVVSVEPVTNPLVPEAAPKSHAASVKQLFQKATPRKKPV